MRFLVSWLISAVALALTEWIVPGIEVAGIGTLLLAALVIGLLNAFIRPILVVLTLPVTILTLGLFLFVINALLLWLAAAITPGFELTGFLAALLGALVMAVIGLALHAIVPGD